MKGESIDQPITLCVRADAGPRVGYGHVSRTLAVVEALREAVPVNVHYLMTRDSDGSSVERIGGVVTLLSGNDVAEVIDRVKAAGGPLLLDTYTTSATTLERVNQAGICCIAFDDGKRLSRYAADMVIDYAPGAEALGYVGLDRTYWCLGPRYFPLGRAFRKAKSPPRGTRARTILVTFGGSDPDDQTARVLENLHGRGHDYRITVLLGPGYRGRAETGAVPMDGVRILRNVAHVAGVFAEADLAICGGGVTALELAFLGVPAICMVLCRDQCISASELARAGAAIDLGAFDRIDDNRIWSTVDATAHDPDRLGSMRRAGRALVDGFGAQRLAAGVLDAWNAHCGISPTTIPGP